MALDLLLSGLPIFCCCKCGFRSNGVVVVFLIFYGYINGPREGDWVGFLFAFDVPFCDYHNSLFSRRCRYIDIPVEKVQ